MIKSATSPPQRIFGIGLSFSKREPLLSKKSKYEVSKSEMNMFMNHDGETIAEAYKRLVALRMKIGGLGCEKYDDGFNFNDELIKSKIVSMIVVTDKKLALNLQLLDRDNQFTP